MKAEMDALQRNGTWSVVSLPSEKKTSRLQMDIQPQTQSRWDN